jgi:hypothetical protein
MSEEVDGDDYEEPEATFLSVLEGVSTGRKYLVWFMSMKM